LHSHFSFLDKISPSLRAALRDIESKSELPKAYGQTVGQWGHEANRKPAVKLSPLKASQLRDAFA